MKSELRILKWTSRKRDLRMEVRILKADDEALKEVARYFQSEEEKTLYGIAGYQRYAVESLCLDRRFAEVIEEYAPDTDDIFNASKTMAGDLIFSEFSVNRGLNNNDTIGSEIYFWSMPMDFDEESAAPSKLFRGVEIRLVRKQSGWYIYDLKAIESEIGPIDVFEMWTAKELREEESQGLQPNRYSGDLFC